MTVAGGVHTAPYRQSGPGCDTSTMQQLLCPNTERYSKPWWILVGPRCKPPGRCQSIMSIRSREAVLLCIVNRELLTLMSFHHEVLTLTLMKLHLNISTSCPTVLSVHALAQLTLGPLSCQYSLLPPCATSFLICKAQACHGPSNICLTWAGDKPRAFVGSRQWIGAIELGYILDTCLGITCKVLTVSSGSDIEGKARELAQHFDDQAGPSLPCGPTMTLGARSELHAP